MWRVAFLLLSLIISITPCFASISQGEEDVPKIFIYHIPDEVEKNVKKTEQTQEVQNITSDDVTADTSGQEDIIAQDDDGDSEEFELIQMENEDYELNDMYSDVLKGYAVYNEDEENAIYLGDNLESPLTIKLNQPYNYKGGKYLASKSLMPSIYSKFSNMEYSIAPVDNKTSRSLGGFTAGTMYNQGIDYAELEQSTGVYSRYDTKHFGIYTAFARTLNSTNSNYNDNIYFAPEWKLNQYMTLRQILSADITKNRKKAEFVVSINPFGKKDTDRLRIELGANATYDDSNALLKNQFKFSTNLKF